jgi:uncharacterized membrane protein HdeD (DUF308 family)
MSSLEKSHSTYWWTPMVFGLIFIITGIWILGSPVESFEQITRLIGVIILLSGAAQVFLLLSSRTKYPRWGLQALGGLIDLVIGLILILNPELLLRIITLFVGIWLAISAIGLIIRAVEASKAKLPRWKWELGLGIFFLLLAGLFFWHPLFIGITIAIWTALAFIILGVFRITLTLTMRRQFLRS